MNAPANIAQPDDYARAVALVQESGKTATSWLQRQLRIGYNAAARHVEQMERDGIVSSPDHVGKRTLLSVDAPTPRAAVEVQMQIPVDLPKEHRAADDKLRLLIERIERLEEEKRGISDDIKDVYLEAKATGYDAKIMRQIVRLRKMPGHDRREMQAILETYLAALGME